MAEWASVWFNWVCSANRNRVVMVIQSRTATHGHWRYHPNSEVGKSRITSTSTCGYKWGDYMMMTISRHSDPDMFREHLIICLVRQTNSTYLLQSLSRAIIAVQPKERVKKARNFSSLINCPNLKRAARWLADLFSIMLVQKLQKGPESIFIRKSWIYHCCARSERIGIPKVLGELWNIPIPSDFI